MKSGFYFKDNTDREVSLTIRHNEDDQIVCRIVADFKPNDKRNPTGVDFSVDSIFQLDEIISALQFIRNQANAEIDHKTPHLNIEEAYLN